MKLLRSLPLICFMAVVLLFGCKKNDTTNNNSTNQVWGFLVKKETDSGATGKTVNTYTYDNQGRVISTNLNGQYSNSFSYQPGKIIGTRTNLSTGTSSQYTYILNAQGLVATDGSATLNLYDADNHLINVIDSDNGTWHQYVYDNGNMVRRMTPSMNHDTFSIYYTYNAEPETRNYGISAFGAPSKNLFVSTYASANPTNTTHFDYIFDSQHRVIEEKMLDSSYNWIESFKYEY